MIQFQQMPNVEYFWSLNCGKSNFQKLIPKYVRLIKIIDGRGHCPLDSAIYFKLKKLTVNWAANLMQLNLNCLMIFEIFSNRWTSRWSARWAWAIMRKVDFSNKSTSFAWKNKFLEIKRKIKLPRRFFFSIINNYVPPWCQRILPDSFRLHPR